MYLYLVENKTLTLHEVLGKLTFKAADIIRHNGGRLKKGATAERLTSNPASGKVLEKIGMQHVGTAQKRDRYDGYSSMELYEIRAENRQPVDVESRPGDDR